MCYCIPPLLTAQTAQAIWSNSRDNQLADNLRRVDQRKRHYYSCLTISLIQVQFGPNEACPSSTRRKQKASLSGGLAGILVATDANHTLSQLQSALLLSFETGGYVKLRKPIATATVHGATSTSKFEIFCDLDGVLVDFGKGLDAAGNCDMTNCGESAKWSTIQKTPRFFADLEWCEDGETLWKLICDMPTDVPPKILTACPGIQSEGIWSERQDI